MTHHMTRPWRWPALLGLALLAILAVASPARAAIELDSFTVTLSDTRAGAHADMTTDMKLELDKQDGKGIPGGALRDTRVANPVGLAGNPNNIAQCTRAQFSTRTCPKNSQIGEGEFDILLGGAIPLPSHAEVYNLVPPKNAPAVFGLSTAISTQVLGVESRPDDYGLDIVVPEAPNLAPAIWIRGSKLTFWGVPWDHWDAPTQAANPRRPFMSNPTSCDRPLETKISVNAYGDPVKQYTSSLTATNPPVTGCDELSADPQLSVAADNVVDSPSRVNVDISVPYDNDAAGRSTPALRDTTVVLPEGMSLNPAMAAGLTACTDAQFGLRSGVAPECPGESAIGIVGIDVPLLGDRIQGRIYVGEPVPGDPYRVFVHGYASGVHVKMLGSITADPRTGRLTTTFNGTPQVPFTRMAMVFRGGPLAPIASATSCGVKTAVATFLPWSGGPGLSRTAGVTVVGGAGNPDCASPAPFNPRFTAGTVGSGAGKDAGLVLAIGREDGQRALGGLRMSLPAGVLGRLTAVPLCSAADGAAGTCSQDSQVGDTTVSVGAGSAPLTLRGRVYLTRPYEAGDVAGMSIVVPGKAGPFDLGTVVVRSRLTMRPDTSIEVVTDPFPTILQGIPLRMRQVIVELGRPGFTFNATDCSPRTITGTVTSADGAEAAVSAPYQASGCADLPFGPSMTIGTAAPSKDGGATGLRVEIGSTPGQSNVRRVELTLPRQLGARIGGPLGTPCPIADWEADRCAESARIGHAEAETEVLPEPLAGAVYFVEGSGGLPRIGVRLKGAVTLDLMGEVALTSDGRVQNVFAEVPDVPLRRFALTMDGGSAAVLTGKGLCAGPLRADRMILSHSGHEIRDSVAVDVSGCATQAASKNPAKGKKAKGKHHNRKAHKGNAHKGNARKGKAARRA
jgi:hypothetical protein